jgi:nucleotide-binding universal stress UspA family protein
MTTVLVPAGSVHESAAACDHLARREDVDRVVGVGVGPPGDDTAARDAGEALNVLAVRLPDVDVETERRTGDPAGATLSAAAEYDVDEVVVAQGYDGVDELTAGSERPVEVVADPAS